MIHWTHNIIDTNGIQMHYQRSGGDKPPFILAHGFADDAGCWPLVADELVARYDVIALDARGHGKSSAPAEGYEIDNQATDYAGLITKLGLIKPTILGHSMGAGITLALAAMYPTLPGKILLEDPPPNWDAMYDFSRTLEGIRVWALDVKHKSHAARVAEAKINRRGWADVEIELWSEAKQRLNMNALNFGTDSAWPKILPNITCATLLITADPNLGGIVNDESAAQLKHLIPQLQVTHVPNAGHHIRRDQFTAYMTAVNAFLAES